ncbi:MAG: type II toxin-antitoxin system VapC family toxin [Chloroflexi bacterium]|nr:type II toxin-antitoxin system VapC family toxin [Chloroflexota bacterium]
MAKYILDTTLLIDHLRGHKEAAELVDNLALDGHRIGVCCVSIAELYSGLGQDEQAAAGDLTDGLEYYDVSREAAKEAGRYRYEYARRGTVLSTADTLIAATAIAVEAILITSNVKDFPMEEIELLEQP